jgi:hypothetical protein
VVTPSTVRIAALILGCSFLTAILSVGYSGNDIVKDCNAHGKFTHVENDRKVTYLCAQRIDAGAGLRQTL